MPPRIAYILEYPTVSGGERSLLCLLDHLDRDRFTPVLMVPENGPMAREVKARGLELRPYSLTAEGRRRPFTEVQEELAVLLESLDIALIHGNSLSCAEYTGLVGQAAGLPAVAHVRDIQKLKKSRRNRLSLNNRLIAVSQGTKSALVEQGLEESLVEVVWNGIPASYCGSELPTQSPWPGWTPGTKMVLNIGQICLRKAQDLCLEAMIPLLQADPALHLLFVGERFSKKEESLRFEQSLHDRTAEEGLLNQVHFAGYRDDVPALLKEALLLVHPAHQEPLGRVLLEAQISGVPVIAMKVGGNAEIIEDGKTGILVPKSELVAFRQAISRLLENEEKRAQMGQRGRLQATERFDPKRSAKRVMDIYEDCFSSVDSGLCSELKGSKKKSEKNPS